MPKLISNWVWYIFYLFLILVNIPILIDPKTKRGDLIFTSISVGIYVGGIIISLFRRFEDHNRKAREDMDRHFWELKTVAAIHAKFSQQRQANAPKAAVTPPPPGSELEEYN